MRVKKTLSVVLPFRDAFSVIAYNDIATKHALETSIIITTLHLVFIHFFKISYRIDDRIDHTIIEQS